MAIRHLDAAMLMSEHIYQPISGTVVSIGNQTVMMSGKQIDRLLDHMGIEIREYPYVIDEATVTGNQKPGAWVTLRSFLSRFCDAQLHILDVSDYEGADIICDLQDSLPGSCPGMADFVIEGGCLDNIFDPASAIQNMSRLLKPGGRIVQYNAGNSHPTAYLKYSADWFMDFYAVNNYADCKTYIVDYPNTIGVPLLGPKETNIDPVSPYEAIIYSYNPLVHNTGGAGYDCSSIEAFSRYEIYCVAEKGKTSTDSKNPIQKHYRTSASDRDISLESARRFKESKRPLFGNKVSFEVTKIPRIDSSEYPEQLQITAVLTGEYIDRIMTTGE